MIGKERGIDETFEKYDINVLIGPAESAMPSFAAAAGYPIATLPLGYLDLNSRPNALAAIAAAHQERNIDPVAKRLGGQLPKKEASTPVEKHKKLQLEMVDFLPKEASTFVDRQKSLLGKAKILQRFNQKDINDGLCLRIEVVPVWYPDSTWESGGLLTYHIGHRRR